MRRRRSRPPNLPIPPRKHNRYLSTLASDDIGGSDFPRDNEETRMPLLAHLKELRVRVIRSAIAIPLGFVISYAIDDWLFSVLTPPLREPAPAHLLLIRPGAGPP